MSKTLTGWSELDLLIKILRLPCAEQFAREGRFHLEDLPRVVAVARQEFVAWALEKARDVQEELT